MSTVILEPIRSLDVRRHRSKYYLIQLLINIKGSRCKQNQLKPRFYSPGFLAALMFCFLCCKNPPHSWESVRTTSFLWQISLKFLKINSETKPELKCLLAFAILFFLLCPKSLCMTGRCMDTSYTWCSSFVI